jgi:AcrR family transcriptional regulator
MYITMDTKERMDTKKRSYEMRARKEATAATRSAIVEAAIDTVVANRSLAITLGAVAERAGVTVKTVLRHFGSREALVDATWSQVRQDVLAERIAPPGDPVRALMVLIEHYEHRGEMVLGLLAEEDSDRRAWLMCEDGRGLHRSWVEELFSAELPADPAERSRLVDALVVATDVYTWKLLRRDRGLSVEDVRDRMMLISNAVLAPSPLGDERAGR